MSLVHNLPKQIIDIIDLNGHDGHNGHYSPFYVESMDYTSIHVYISSGRLYLDIIFSITGDPKKITGIVNARPSYFEYLSKGLKSQIEQLEKNINSGKYDTAIPFDAPVWRSW